jgi:hypothetical protein
MSASFAALIQQQSAAAEENQRMTANGPRSAGSTRARVRGEAPIVVGETADLSVTVAVQ